MKIALVCALSLALGVSSPGLMAAAPLTDTAPSATSAGHEFSRPEQMLHATIYQLEQFVALGGSGDELAVINFLNRTVAPMFDFEGLSRWAAGPIHRELSAQQKLRLSGRIQSMFMGALARNLGSYTRPMPRIQLIPARSQYENQSHVRARVVRNKSSRPIFLDFRFYKSDDAWKIFDVAANNNSAATYYRAFIRREWRRDSLNSLLQ